MSAEQKSDPRGVAAARGQSGPAALPKNRSKTGEKGVTQATAEGKSTITPTKVQLAVGREPTFFIGGGNGVALVEGPLTELGWKRITDKQNENYKMKWVECKNTINYNAFKEGDQLVNHIPNCNLLTNKMGLLDSLQSYERLNSNMKRRETRIKLNDFVPETYRLDDPKERELFLETFDSNDIWICKPTGMNQGKGIYLVRDLEEFKTTLQERDEKLHNSRRPHRANMGRIIQRYIPQPLLLDGKKFDIRAYMLVASTAPYLVLYHKGYVRLSLMDYDPKAEDLTAHLTNQYIQKRDPNYKEDKESTAWSMDKFNEYVNEHVAPEKELEYNWVYNTLTSKMKAIMSYCFHAVKNKLHCKVGYFDLYGLDFMVDRDMRVYLIEVNVNPSLATNCEALKEVIPGVVRETLHLSLECFEKSRRGQPLIPLHSLDKFEILYNGCTKSKDRSSAPASTPLRTGTFSPVRRQRSPGKEVVRSSHRLHQSLSESKSGGRVRYVGMTPKSTSQARAGIILPPLVSVDKSTMSSSASRQKTLGGAAQEKLKHEAGSAAPKTKSTSAAAVVVNKTETKPEATMEMPLPEGTDGNSAPAMSSAISKESDTEKTTGPPHSEESSVSEQVKSEIIADSTKPATSIRGQKAKVQTPNTARTSIIQGTSRGRLISPDRGN